MPMDAVEVRRSPRARRWRLEVPWGEPARLTVPQSDEPRGGRAPARWRSAPGSRSSGGGRCRGFGLERLAVSESEARIGARELVSALAEEEAERIGVTYQRIRIGRPADALGLVLCTRHALLQLAAGASAARGARLRGRARAVPPARSRPFAAVLGARRAHRPHWRHQRDWLRRHGPELLAFRPSSEAAGLVGNATPSSSRPTSRAKRDGAR